MGRVKPAQEITHTFVMLSRFASPSLKMSLFEGLVHCTLPFWSPRWTDDIAPMKKMQGAVDDRKMRAASQLFMGLTQRVSRCRNAPGCCRHIDQRPIQPLLTCGFIHAPRRWGNRNAEYDILRNLMDRGVFSGKPVDKSSRCGIITLRWETLQGVTLYGLMYGSPRLSYVSDT